MPEEIMNDSAASASNESAPEQTSQAVETQTPAPVEKPAVEAKQTEKPAKKEEKPKNLKEHFESLAKKKAEKADSVKQAKDASQVAKPDNADGKQATSEKPADKWTPTFKFKVKDKEYDMPEWAKAAITSKEAEKEFVDLFTKAEGLETIKGSREEAIQRATKAETEIDGMKSYVSGVLQLRDSKNWDKFYKHMKIPERDIVEHALKIVERNNLPPEQKELYNKTVEQQDEIEAQQTQYEQVREMLQQTATYAKKADLQSALAKADHSKYAENYDSVNGEPGKFRQEVINYGEYIYNTTGKDLSAEEAINAVKMRLGKGYIPQDKPVMSQEVQTEQIPVVKKDLPVIPNIAGKNVSHVQKTVRSTADLRKLAKEKFA